MKDLLRQYNSLIKEIKELNQEIKHLESLEPKHAKDKVTGSNTEFPYNIRHYTIEGIVEDERLIRKKEILKERKIKCEDIKIQIEEFINDIPDSLTRRVFRYRYVEELSWQQIARRIGRYDESYPRKVIHDKYLDGLDKDA